MTRVYFVRHGESEANLQHCFAGWYNCHLTERGEAQAKATAQYLQEAPITTVYASDLHRAYDTGAIIAASKNIPITGDTRLREIDAGAWEGLSFTDLAAQFPAAFERWVNNVGLAACTEGESVAQLQQRVRGAVEDIVRCHPGETLCIATHATPIRVMECVWQGLSLSNMHTFPWVKNASVTVVDYDEDGVGHLVERDIHAHLGALNTALPTNV